MKNKVIGYGTWGLSGLDYGKISSNKSFKLLSYAYKKGINFFDTAPLYGDGRVEKLIGKLVKKIDRKKILICTKCGMLPHKGFKMKQNFKYEKIHNDINKSLKNLNTNYIDILLLHSPKIKKNSIHNIILNLEKLIKVRKVKKIGISLRSPNDIKKIPKKSLKKIDYFEFNFNLLDQRAIKLNLFNFMKKNKIKSICRTPLGFGFLSDKNIIKSKLDDTDHRKNWSNKQINRWNKFKYSFKGVQVKYSKNLSEFSLLFCKSFSFDYIIPGILSLTDIDTNLNIFKKKRIKKYDLKKIFNIYNNIENKIYIQKRKRD